MEPRIQYAQTKDGANIAFWTLGEGMPFVQMPSSSMLPSLRAWKTPEGRQWYERLAQKRTLIRFDTRGCGHSAGEVSDYSLDARMLDLEAVVDRLGLERFVLFGYWESGPVAIAYAARNPKRVSHLLLWCTSPCGTDFIPKDLGDVLIDIAEKNWEFYVQMVQHGVIGWSAGEHPRLIAAALGEGMTPEKVRAVREATEKDDVTDLLPQVQAPALVFHRRQLTRPPTDVARLLAARLPDARLVLLEGDSVMPYVGDMDEVLAAIDEFLGEGEEAAAGAEPPEAGAFRTVLFTDVEGSTALTQRLGDAKARALLREHERLVREALKAHGGAELKTLGDGFMTSFSSATKALECAIAVQRAFAAHNESAQEPIRVRIGLNAGEPIAEEQDLFGTAVIRAARIAAKARGGEVLASDVVRQLVEGKDFVFADKGEVSLRGFDDPVRLYEVRWTEEG
jgi:class 3 adenylate cyclase